MALINVSICLSDIPKERIKTSEKNGKKYLSIVVADKRETDQYGNDTTVYISQSKEERDAEVQKIYIGSGKKVAFNGNNQNNQQAAQPQPQQQQQTPPPVEPVDDLPF